MDKRRIAAILIIVAAVIVVGAGMFFLFSSINQENSNDKKVAENTTVNTSEKTVPVTGNNVKTDGTDTVAEDPTHLEDYIKINSDIYSWIYIPNTNINYPVAQSRMDDNFYLEHDIYKNYSFPGTIYSQLCNGRGYNDRVTVLYGHNMLDGSMFADLHKFEDARFFNDNPYFYVYTEDRKLTYEIVSAYDYDDRHIMNSFDFRDDEVFQRWIDEAKNPRSLSSNVRDSAELDLNSKLLVLSTCQNYDSGRFLVQGVLIRDEKTE